MNGAPTFGGFFLFLVILAQSIFTQAFELYVGWINQLVSFIIVINSDAVSRNLNWRQNLLFERFTWTLLAGPFAISSVGV